MAGITSHPEVMLLALGAAVAALSWVTVNARQAETDYWRGVTQLTLALGIAVVWYGAGAPLIHLVLPMLPFSLAPKLAGLLEHVVTAIWGMALIMGVPATFELWFKRFAELRAVNKHPK